MTKQYKLVKFYPGSPELGTIASTEKNKNIDYFEFTNKYMPKKGFIDAEIIENNPEFWEKIKQEEYTILSIKKVNFKESGIEEWTPEKSFSISLEAMLTIGISVRSGDYYINSIRRNSDGQIISVGDMCKPREYGLRAIVNKISIVDGKFLRFSSNRYCLGLENLDKCEFLFTTKDGVDLYENDNYYTVLTGSNSGISEEVNGPYVADVRDYVSYNIEYFSSKEKAQEFLDSLKPKVLFTTEDGVDVYDKEQELWDTLDYSKNNEGCSLNYLSRTKAKHAINIKRKFWFDKQKAENYILLNKPCLSVKEVFELLDSKVELWKYGRTTSKVIETFKNHVKLKS